MEKRILYVVYTIAILELAFAQVHITAITTTYSNTIGIYLFSFIVCGLISMLQIGRLLADKPKYFRSIISLFIAVILGLIYSEMLITGQEVAINGLKTIRGSLIATGLGVFGYCVVVLLELKLWIKSRGA